MAVRTIRCSCAVLIAASGIYTAYREHKMGRAPAEAQTMPEAN